MDWLCHHIEDVSIARSCFEKIGSARLAREERHLALGTFSLQENCEVYPIHSGKVNVHQRELRYPMYFPDNVSAQVITESAIAVVLPLLNVIAYGDRVPP